MGQQPVGLDRFKMLCVGFSTCQYQYRHDYYQ